jgi:hypothetical protein
MRMEVARARDSANAPIAGDSLREDGFLSKVVRKGREIAGKAVVISTIAVMSLGVTGCGESKKAQESKDPVKQGQRFDERGFGDYKGVMDFKLREARLKAREMMERDGRAPAIQGDMTTDSQGNRVSVECRWRQLMREAGENKVRSADEVERMSAEIESLEKSMGEAKMKSLSEEFNRGR